MHTRGGYARACALLAGVLAAGLGATIDGQATTTTAPVPAGTAADDQVRADVRTAVSAARDRQPIPADFEPALAALPDQKADVGACDYNTSTRRLCRRGDRSSGRTIVVLGDSHARHWIPAIDRAARRNGFAVYFLVKPSCNASYMQRTRPSGARNCNAFRDWASAQVRRLQPELLVIAGQVPESARAGDGHIVHGQQRLVRMYGHGVARRIRSLDAAVGRAVVIADAPGLRDRPGHCLRVRANDLGDCAFAPTARDRREIRASRRAAQRTGSGLVDPRPWFCADGLCPTIVGGFLTYRDLEHVTPPYSGRLAGAMASALRLTDRKG